MKETGPLSFPVGVAYVLPGLGRGGTEKHVLDLASRIDRRRFLPCVISTSEDGTMEEDFRMQGVPVFRLPYRGLSIRPTKFLPLLRDAVRFFRGFARILAERRVVILHAYLPAANIVGPVVARLTRVPRVIVSKRAMADYKERFPGLSRIEPLGNRLADVILVNSDAVRRDVERTEKHWEGKF
ncbi:MAG: glycosyltransferase, partial [Deltaproteobacteria bacterium]|nr:glycosyltransferase [Deltaproteobacteria bacterium]